MRLELKNLPFQQKFRSEPYRKDALDQKITREDLTVFSAPVNTTLETTPIDVVDRTILSMGKKINEIIKGKGIYNIVLAKMIFLSHEILNFLENIFNSSSIC